MGRKLRSTLPSADAEKSGPVGVVELPDGTTTGKRKRGRPSKASIEAEARARADIEREERERLREATEVTPEQMRPVVEGFLVAVGRLIGGDMPTRQEIETVSKPAAAVSNKYNATFRYAQEMMLAASVVFVLQAQYARGAEQRAERKAAKAEEQARRRGVEPNAKTQRDSGGDGSEGVGQDPTSAIVSAAAGEINHG
jgi:hypothetical protein